MFPPSRVEVKESCCHWGLSLSLTIITELLLFPFDSGRQLSHRKEIHLSMVNRSRPDGTHGQSLFYHQPLQKPQPEGGLSSRLAAYSACSNPGCRQKVIFGHHRWAKPYKTLLCGKEDHDRTGRALRTVTLSRHVQRPLASSSLIQRAAMRYQETFRISD